MNIAQLSRSHLEAVVAIDSQSDETSATIPSSDGQRRLSDWLAGFFRQQGCAVDRDGQANMLAALPGRGSGADKQPVALLVHLDTARGTAAVPSLHLEERWDGRRIPYPRNERLWVDIETYPAAGEFLGQSLLYGPGEAPFGLDDKLGLAHLMTLSVLLKDNPAIPHPPLLLVGRPDEEIGRMEAVEGLADELQRRGVRVGFTIDGVLPYEINVENFNAAHASLLFPARPLALPAGASQHEGRLVRVFLGGVNTHGCSAKAEGFRAATRLGAEVLAELRREGLCPARLVPLSLRSMPERDCDGELVLYCAGGGAQLLAELAAAVRAVMEPHLRRGASYLIGAPEPCPDGAQQSGATWDALLFVDEFLASAPGFVLAAEDSDGRQGYSNPYRAAPQEGGAVRLDVRLRDFDRQILDEREAHVRRLGEARGAAVTVTQQYANMGPRLLEHAELLTWPRRAAGRLGIEPRVLPIRGGTGVDPFLARGIPIGNLGTGYFAPESEKEFTSLEMLEGHARWLVALMQEIAC